MKIIFTKDEVNAGKELMEVINKLDGVVTNPFKLLLNSGVIYKDKYITIKAKVNGDIAIIIDADFIVDTLDVYGETINIAVPTIQSVVLLLQQLTLNIDKSEKVKEYRSKWH